MALLYKLGDGPINYDWNQRFVSVESTELLYSPSPNDRDKKIINIHGGAVTNICKIKGKNFAFCVIIPPPLNKIIYLAADKYEDAIKWRDIILKATLNNADENFAYNYEPEINEGKININAFSRLDQEKDDIPKVGMFKNLSSKNTEDTFQKFPSDFISKLELWRTEIILNDSKFVTKFQGDLKISTPKDISLNYISFLIDISIKFISVFLMFYIVNSFLCYFNLYWTSLIIELILFALGLYRSKYSLLKLIAGVSFLSSKKNCDYEMKASTIIECDRQKIIDVLMDYSLRHEWDYFITEKHNIIIKRNDQAEMKITPYFNNFFLSAIFALINFCNGRHSDHVSYNLDRIKFSDDKKNCYILFRESNCNKNSFNSSILLESFVLIPIKDIDHEKTLVIYMTNLDINLSSNYCDNYNLPYLMRQYIKNERLTILESLKEYLKLADADHPERYLTKLEKKKQSDHNLMAVENEYDEDEMETVRSHFFSYDEVDREKKRGSFGLSFPKKEFPMNPNSIIPGKRRIPLEERFQAYFRNPEGGVECRNYAELRTQDGLFLDLMKRAGRQLLEGKNIIALSLPARIFEPRSTLTRITDLWGSGMLYLNRAASCMNPVERMKNIIAFSIAGIHMNVRQLKPFNPIIGETYEAFWPDGSKIYSEHMSHHPPISRFLILSGNNTWRFHGYYEYLAKVKSITGNVAGGQFRGPNIVDFLLTEDSVEFTLPMMNISGMMYGKRIIEWEGTMEYKDEKNNITAQLTFTKAPRFYQKFIEPTDIVRGELKQGEKVIHKIYGSPLENLMFDDEVFWELETCEIILANEPKFCLPSDPRYRTDLLALAKGDIQLADSEKARLEVLQRADRSARQKFAQTSSH